jgi:hypothetical protein
VWGLLGMVAVYLIWTSRAGLLLYPMYFVGILEAPRIFYWGSSRAFPSWLMSPGSGTTAMAARTHSLSSTSFTRLKI